MKLAEALILRADAQKNIAMLRDRLRRAVRVQEGDTPAEPPESLLQELASATASYVRLVKRINLTNASTPFSTDGGTLTEALADREGLAMTCSTLSQAIEAAGTQDVRWGRSEVKFVATIDVAALQKQFDDASRRMRELDMRIQQVNWQVDLIE